MSSWRPLSALVAALALLAACGSDDDVDPAPYIQAQVDELLEGEDGPPLQQDSAECLAEAVVEGVGADTLDDADVTPEAFAEAESLDDLSIDVDEDALRSDLTERFGDCELGGTLAELFAGELPFELDEEGSTCVADALDDGTALAEGLAASFVDGDDSGFEGAFLSALADCPAIISDLISDSIESAGVTVDAEARQCIADEVDARGEQGISDLLDGGAAAQQLGVELAEACLEG